MISNTQTQQIKDRIELLVDLDKKSDDYNRRYYDTALLEIKSHLQDFFNRYAKENHLSMTDLSNRVDKWGREQWKQAIDSMGAKDFTREGKIRVKAMGILAKADNHKLLIALIGLSLIKLKENITTSLDERITKDVVKQQKFMKKLFKETKKPTSSVTSEKTMKLWSDNLWIKTDELANDVEKLVNKHLRHGVSLDDLDNSLGKHLKPKPYKNISDRINQLETTTKRIVRNESARLINQVNISTYMSKGIQKVNLVLQAGACDLCEAQANYNPFSIDEAPDIPIHVNCRCGLEPA